MKIDELQCDHCGKREDRNSAYFRWVHVGRLEGEPIYSWGGADEMLSLDFCSFLCAAGWFSDRVREND